MEWAEPPVLPSINLPEALKLPIPILEVPRADIPSYKPLVVPPSDLRPPPGIKGTTPSDKPKPVPPTPLIKDIPKPEVPTIRVPYTDLDIPVPDGAILTTAATTAVVSVAATLAATSLFKYLVMIMKPIFKQAWNKLQKKTNPKKIS